MENIIWESRPSLLLYWPKYVLQTLIALSWLFFPRDIVYFEFFQGVYFYHLAGLLSIVIILSLTSITLQLRCIKYELSEERFLAYSGVFSRKREVIELYRIKDLQVISPFYLRVFGFSNIFMHTSDKSAPTFRIAAIKNAYQTESMMRDRVEELRKIKGVREFD